MPCSVTCVSEGAEIEVRTVCPVVRRGSESKGMRVAWVKAGKMSGIVTSCSGAGPRILEGFKREVVEVEGDGEGKVKIRSHGRGMQRSSFFHRSL